MSAEINIKVEAASKGKHIDDMDDSSTSGDSIVSLSEKENIKKEMKVQEREKALKSMQNLLGISEKFSSFCCGKLSSVLNKSELNASNTTPSKLRNAPKAPFNLKYFKNGTLRDYQNEGITWLFTLYEYGINGILADEMGLGKTVQVIGYICRLVEKNVKGPFMIVVPLSTLTNWQQEFQRFAPDLFVTVFYGNKQTRDSLKKKLTRVKKIESGEMYPVILSTYESVQREIGYLEQIRFKVIIVDEGHRIKNHKSKLSLDLRKISTNNKILLTGTPLQNNITELWSLLNFLMPSIFTKIDTFAALVALEDLEEKDKIIENEKSAGIISTIHKVLKPFMLRRLKKDVLEDSVPKKEVIVYCPLTKLQLDLYKYSLQLTMMSQSGLNYYKDEEMLEEQNEPRRKRRCAEKNGTKYFNEDKNPNTLESTIQTFKRRTEKIFGLKIDDMYTNLFHKIYNTNVWMTLKEIVDHPFIIYDPTSHESTDVEELVKSSGKMLLLDALLPKLREKGHRVLIFSNFIKMLMILADYLGLRGHKYCMLYGSMSLEDRQEEIKKFNNDEDIFAFLISTRAGGLGLNLTSADTVILFDRDWNPQVDNQAQDRCHRIGQTKPVLVYSLITKDTIDEKILKVSQTKVRLEKLIIKDGKFKNLSSADKATAVDELKQMLDEAEKTQQFHTNLLNEEEIEKLVDRSDMFEEMKRN